VRENIFRPVRDGIGRVFIDLLPILNPYKIKKENEKNDEYANDECNYRMSDVELISEQGLTI